MVRFLGAAFFFLVPQVVVAADSIILPRVDSVETNEIQVAGRAVITVCPNRQGKRIDSTNTRTHSMYSTLP